MTQIPIVKLKQKNTLCLWLWVMTSGSRPNVAGAFFLHRKASKHRIKLLLTRHQTLTLESSRDFGYYIFMTRKRFIRLHR